MPLTVCLSVCVVFNCVLSVCAHSCLSVFASPCVCLSQRFPLSDGAVATVLQPLLPLYCSHCCHCSHHCHCSYHCHYTPATIVTVRSYLVRRDGRPGIRCYSSIVDSSSELFGHIRRLCLVCSYHQGDLTAGESDGYPSVLAVAWQLTSPTQLTTQPHTHPSTQPHPPSLASRIHLTNLTHTYSPTPTHLASRIYLANLTHTHPHLLTHTPST